MYLSELTRVCFLTYSSGTFPWCAHQGKVPEEYVRKQTLVNSERYITEDLKLYEEKVLNAESNILILKMNFFKNSLLKY